MVSRFHLAGHGEKFLTKQLRHWGSVDGKKAWSCWQMKKSTENTNKKRKTGKEEEESLPS